MLYTGEQWMMMTMIKALAWVIPVVFAVLVCGCDEPGSSETRYVLRQHEGLPGMERTEAVDEPDAVLEMVKASEIEDAGEVLTVEQWVERQLQADGGQVMFPQWEVKRRGTRRYTVDFTYTLLRDNYAIEKKGFRWNVDYVLQLVGAPGYIAQEELERETGHKSIMNDGEPGAERIINLE
jgi:hypothetical protein